MKDDNLARVTQLPARTAALPGNGQDSARCLPHDARRGGTDGSYGGSDVMDDSRYAARDLCQSGEVEISTAKERSS